MVSDREGEIMLFKRKALITTWFTGERIYDTVGVSKGVFAARKRKGDVLKKKTWP